MTVPHGAAGSRRDGHFLVLAQSRERGAGPGTAVTPRAGEKLLCPTGLQGPQGRGGRRPRHHVAPRLILLRLWLFRGVRKLWAESEDAAVGDTHPDPPAPEPRLPRRGRPRPGEAPGGGSSGREQELWSAVHLGACAPSLSRHRVPWPCGTAGSTQRCGEHRTDGRSGVCTGALLGPGASSNAMARAGAGLRVGPVTGTTRSHRRTFRLILSPWGQGLAAGLLGSVWVTGPTGLLPVQAGGGGAL